MKTKNRKFFANTMSFFCISIFALIISFSSVIVNAQSVYYVSISGADTNDGLTWQTSFASIQKGINEANNAANLSEVWVAQGTYYPSEYLTDYFGQQSTDVYKSVIMYSGVNVYGGFEGIETTKEIGVSGGRQLADVNAWNFAFPTIIDGANAGSYHTVWFASNGFESVTYQSVSGIYIPTQLPEQTIMDGFTITGGFANIDSKLENTNDAKRKFVHLAGGGVALVGAGELHNCIVENNKAKYGGAGVAMFDGAYMHNCLVQENEAVGANFYYAGIFGFGAFNYWRTDGSGVVAMGFSDQSIVDNCTIHNNLGLANDNYPSAASSSNNKTNNGGGIYISNSIIQNSIISSNNIAVNPSSYDDGASASCGGGLYVYADGLVDNCEITDNGFVSGSQNGAGIFMADYSSEASSYSDIIIRNSFIHTNRAGGGVAVDAQYSTVENNIVANNNGAGIYGYGNCRRLRTVNCLVYNNSSTGWGHSTSSNNKENQLINSTIVRNGSGIGIGSANSHVVSNSIVWGNNSNPATISNATVTYSAFSFTPPSGIGNIELSTDNASGPAFMNPTASHTQNLVGWQDADFSLGLGSDCIDVANPSTLPAGYVTDIVGNNRILGCELDMGAYESLMGGPVLSLAANSVEFGQSIEIETCANTNYQLSVVDAITGNLPFTISWTVNGSSSHLLAGNDVVVSTPGQVLLNFNADQDYLIGFTAIADNTACEGNPELYTIDISTYQPEMTVVLNTQDISIISEIEICEGEIADFRLSELTEGEFPLTVSWTVNSDPLHPLSGTNVVVSSADFELFNEILAAGTYEIVFTELTDNTGCSLSDLFSLAFDLVVNSKPSVFMVINSEELYTDYSENFCVETPINISISEMQNGEYPIYCSWTVNGNAEHEYSMQDVEVTSNGQILFNATPVADSYEFVFTSIVDANGCSVDDLSIFDAEIVINELPEVICSEDLVVTDETSVLLEGSTPDGGTYSGVGVESGYFNPTGLTNGYYAVTYEYLDLISGCASNCEFNISLEIPTEIDGIDINNDVINIDVCYGTDEISAIQLLAQQITISDVEGAEYLVGLSWSVVSYQANIPAIYHASASFDLPAGMIQTTPPIDLIVEADITVVAEPQINITISEEALTSGLIVNYCDDETAEMIFVNAPDEFYPYTLSWTVNGSSEHPQAGNNVVVSSQNDLLISDIFAEGVYEIVFTSLTDGHSCAASDLSEYTATINVTNCTNIGNNSDQMLLVYPNPASDILFVKLPDCNTEYNYRIVNIMGETIIKMDSITNDTEINIENLTNGTYFLILESNTDLHYVKFIKNL